jgi:ComF family protein
MQDFVRQSIIDFLIPNQCIVCQRLSKVNLCGDCISKIPNQTTLWLKDKPKTQPLFVPKFNTRIQPILKDGYIDSILSCTDFKNHIIRKSIHYLKYKNLPQIANPLGSIMLRSLSQNLRLKENIILCPIPLHPNRLKFRDYNQALLLAEYLNKQLNLDIYNELYRIRDTPNQMKINDRETRIQNMNNAFEARQKASTDGLNIVLIDDVTTTLSTIQEAAKALSKMGFHSINALVLAH